MLISSQNITKHSSYKTDQKYHDIAIIELKREVEFSATVFPACLNTNESDEEKVLTVIGFGRTNRDNSKFGPCVPQTSLISFIITALQTATWLQKTKVNELPLTECNKTLIDIYGGLPSTMKMNNGLKKTTLCATSKDLKDACEGLLKAFECTFIH